jgi:hypothetical protein
MSAWMEVWLETGMMTEAYGGFCGDPSEKWGLVKDAM